MHCVPNYIIVSEHLNIKFLRFLKVRYTARTTKMLTFITEFTAISHHCRSLFLHIVLCYCLADFYYDQKVFLLHFLQGKSNVNDVLQLLFSGNVLICISALRTFSSYKILLTILSFNTLNLTTYCLSKVSDQKLADHVLKIPYM